MLIAYVPLLLALVGAAIWILASNPKAQELGRALFWTGMLVVMLTVAHQTFRIG